jgi:ABC transporter with metal-binding/Fe-S-binding domain ATP-binding protein
MKLAILFSGGKDSVYAAYLAKKAGNEVTCLITVHSANKDSYMFHTPSINKTEAQAKAMNVPLIIQKTEGKKEEELKDLKHAIQTAINKYKIEGIVTGALRSVYQASRIQKICNELNIECINPLWQKDEIEYLNELVKKKFRVIITGVGAEGFDESWLGRIISNEMIEELKQLNKKYKIHMAFEGGEAETFVLDCPLFKKPLKVKSFEDISSGENSWRREIEVE